MFSRQIQMISSIELSIMVINYPLSCQGKKKANDLNLINYMRQFGREDTFEEYGSFSNLK
jgi:hypothetical protein